MSDPQTRSNVWQGAAASRDAGLRAYMLRVYNLMALAIAFTALVSYYVASNQVLVGLIHGTPLVWVVIVALIVVGMVSPKIILSGSTSAAHLAFWSYALLWGLLVAGSIYVSSQANITRAFFITSAAFASLSFYGYTTKRDLSAWERFIVMASIGVLIAIVVHLVLVYIMGIYSEIFSLIISGAVVLLVSAMTAYDTQKVKDSYDPSDSVETAKSKAIFGSFLLYGSFVVMFIHILNILNIFGRN